MIRKSINIVFSLVFIVLLVLPLVFMNIQKNQVSEIDNQYLPELEWEEDTTIKEKILNAEDYINKRVGFRVQSLTIYQILNDRLFHIMEHPSYMYGKDGWVFFSGTTDYQHLNLDMEWAEDFASWMQTFDKLAKKHGAYFYYFLIPDKKTIYPEYYPDGYNIYGDVSRTDQVLNALGQTNVDFFYVLDVLLEAKTEVLVCNRQYDAGHWNDDGAFISIRALIDHIRKDFPSIQPLDKSEFTIDSEHMDSLQVSLFPISEDVPAYELSNQSIIDDSEWLCSIPVFSDARIYANRYVNPVAKDMPKLLMLVDSYMMEKEKYLLNHFSEVTFVHRYNLIGPKRFEEYLDILKPDIVIFENPERSFPITFSDKD